MRELDHSDLPGLGQKIAPAPSPAPQPRKHNDTGTVVVNPDGRFSTSLPPPPPKEAS